MLDWLKKRKEGPLTGAPSVRRQKSYSGRSGYVYQYFYDGCRRTSRAGEEGTEYVFDVSADRKTSFAVSVFFPDAAAEPWQRDRERVLKANERYAIAKMALFQAFDERERPELMQQEVRLRPADVAAILETLGIY